MLGSEVLEEFLMVSAFGTWKLGAKLISTHLKDDIALSRIVGQRVVVFHPFFSKIDRSDRPVHITNVDRKDDNVLGKEVELQGVSSVRRR